MTTLQTILACGTLYVLILCLLFAAVATAYPGIAVVGVLLVALFVEFFFRRLA